MPYTVELGYGGRPIATLGLDGKVNYEPDEVIRQRVQELIAGQATTGGSAKSFVTNVRVVYRWDRNRKANNDAVYLLWKRNPIIQNRIRDLNALVFGRGFTYSYDDATKQIVDRFWRINRFRQRLNPMGTDSQLYGEVFIGLVPQDNGDVLAAVYESNQIEIDFNPANVDDINFYQVAYKDEESGKDVVVKYKPVYKYMNEIEMSSSSPENKIVRAVRRMLGKKGNTGLSGFDGTMIHIKFNNGTSEVHGTSDFRQVYQTINDYMDFRGDRLAIHQIYGSPMFDIEIDTDDTDVIKNRISDLGGFTMGSNPVHNSKEKWKPLEFNLNADSAEHDEKAMRGLICAGTGFPEHILFNQGDTGNDDGTFTLNKLAEDRQDAFGEAFIEMHKFIVSISGGDVLKVEEGQLVFPEISTMSEKTKAETYVLKIGAGMVSRKTACFNTGHNWDTELTQMLEEQTYFGLGPDSNTAGALGGRFSSRLGNQNPNADHGDSDRKARADEKNISTQTFGNRKTND